MSFGDGEKGGAVSGREGSGEPGSVEDGRKRKAVRGCGGFKFFYKILSIFYH